MMDSIKYVVNILIVALLFAAIAINKDGRVGGVAVADMFRANNDQSEVVAPDTYSADGVRVINTTSLAKDVVGYGGTTPLNLYVEEGEITRIELLPNSETPSFQDQVVASGLLEKWSNKSLAEAATAQVDIVSGATYTADAIIKNVQRGAQYGASVEATSSNPFAHLNLATLVGILVIVMGAVITLTRPKNKLLTIVQLSLNVVVLGFWCGSFLSLSQFVSWASNGFNLARALLATLLLVVTLVMPLLGRKGSYCHMHCPMGAAQELLGMLPLPKLKLGQKLTRFLNRLRYYILVALLFMMWIGVGFDLMNYEVFSAFILESASPIVLTMALLFLLLSLVVTRPYCRFICPTGALITLAQKSKE